MKEIKVATIDEDILHIRELELMLLQCLFS